MLTIDEINKALHEVDPEAYVEFVLHDEITVTCSEEHTNAVNQRLSELLFERAENLLRELRGTTSEGTD